MYTHTDREGNDRRWLYFHSEVTTVSSTQILGFYLDSSVDTLSLSLPVATNETGKNIPLPFRLSSKLIIANTKEQRNDLLSSLDIKLYP